MTIRQRWMLAGVALATGVVIHFLSPILAPFVVSLVLAYLGDPVADRLEKMGMSRSLSVTVVFLALFIAGLVLLLVLVPALFHQIKTVIQLLPVWEAWVRNNVVPELLTYIEVDPEWFDLSVVVKQLATEWQQTGGIIADLSRKVTSSGLAIAGFVVNLFLVPVVTFYLLRDWNEMMLHLRLIMPLNMEAEIVTLSKECDEVLGAFLKGQLMVMLALGVIYGAGLWLIGLQFAMLIGLLAGLASIIPYMGFFVGFATAIIVALFQFDQYWALLAVTAVFTVGQMLEGYVLTPWLVGDKIGLHPVAVIFALMAGGQLFGFIGMLIALPLAAIIMVLLRHLHRNYKASDLYHAGEPGDKPEE
ncbi:AI-2E family transporter [Endozoicomonas gorgoniicola]|uniref:AI-2E family transporter n=1 Tax=Endozoicomonas gorgoniicola TaxID=1234144 RepID=A0ABT3MVX8_9GAMM|nr:AI-2E family transporter [Endozoicomonas gorgoniicola]MCW7553541.1 AI-2E family transporter [Endozoicomonas gorgoniicola]